MVLMYFLSGKMQMYAPMETRRVSCWVCSPVSPVASPFAYRVPLSTQYSASFAMMACRFVCPDTSVQCVESHASAVVIAVVQRYILLS